MSCILLLLHWGECYLIQKEKGEYRTGVVHAVEPEVSVSTLLGVPISPPYLSVVIGGINVTALVDTGAEVSIDLITKPLFIWDILKCVAYPIFCWPKTGLPSQKFLEPLHSGPRILNRT